MERTEPSVGDIIIVQEAVKKVINQIVVFPEQITTKLESKESRFIQFSQRSKSKKLVVSLV